MFETTCFFVKGDFKEYFSLTCHNIDSDFKRHNLVLGAECLTEAPTGAYMAEVLCRTWDKWQIEKRQVHIVLRDGAKAMEKLVQEAGVMDEWCLSHVLQVSRPSPTTCLWYCFLVLNTT